MERSFEYLSILCAVQKRLDFLEETGYDFKMLAFKNPKELEENQKGLQRIGHWNVLKNGKEAI